jgi:hypothetical protein
MSAQSKCNWHHTSVTHYHLLHLLINFVVTGHYLKVGGRGMKLNTRVHLMKMLRIYRVMLPVSHIHVLCPYFLSSISIVYDLSLCLQFCFQSKFMPLLYVLYVAIGIFQNNNLKQK